jgi:hypothetical protein
MVEMLAGFIVEGGFSFWKYAERKFAAIQLMLLSLLRWRRHFLLATLSLTNVYSSSEESKIETSGDRRG